MRVLVLGDVMLDVVVRALGEVQATSDTPAAVRVARGGSGANVAAALVGAGHEVTFVGAAGDDAAAQLWCTEADRVGVAHRLERVAAPTGVVVSLVGADAQRSMFTERGANASLSADFLESVLASPYAHLHVSGYSVLDPATRPRAERALAHARANGASTSVDVCSAGPLRLVGPATFAASVRGVDLLFANEEEATLLAGEELPGAVARLRALAREGLVTRGAHGALAWGPDEAREHPAAPAEVLDTTGAGDAASGAYLGARLLGADYDTALTRALASAARVIEGLGADG